MKYLTILLLCATLTGCGLIQKITDKAYHKKNENQTTKTQTKKDSTGTVKTTVTEKIDTSLRQHADTVTGRKTLDQLISGQDIEVDDDTTALTVHFDPVTNTVTGHAITKPKTTRLQIDRTVTTEQTATQKTTTNQTNKKSLTTVDKEKTVKTTRVNYAWIWIIITVLIIAGLFFYVRKKFL